MQQTTNEIRLQACLLILFTCSLLAGLLGVFTSAFPLLPVPQSLLLSGEGAVGVLVGGIALAAVFADWQKVRWVAGAVLAALALYSIGHNLLDDPLGDNVSVITGNKRLESLPSLALLLTAGVAFLGLRGTVARRYAFATGCIGVLIGAFVVSGHIYNGVVHTSGELINGFTLIAGLLCVGFGSALVILSRRQHGRPFLLRRDGIVFGVLGVAATFVLSSMASWSAHAERRDTAQATLQHYAELLNVSLDSSLDLIDRLANRWASLDFNVPTVLQQTEARWYFSDIPALLALQVINGDGTLYWRSARAPEGQRWLTEQLARADVKAWLAQQHDTGSSRTWLFPDARQPLKALARVTPENAPGQQFIAVFDLETLAGLGQGHNGFDISLVPASVAAASVPASASVHTIHERTRVAIANGPDLELSAVAGPLSVVSMRGALPPSVFVFGLVMSYLLILGRSLVTVQRGQAEKLSVLEQRFRSLFSQSPDAVFAFDRNGVYQAVNPIAQAIVGFTDDDMGVTSYRDVLTPEAMHEGDFAVFDAAFHNTIEGDPQNFEVGFINSEGQRRTYECVFVPIVVNEQIEGVFAIVKDVSERVEAQENQRILQKSLESSDNAVMVVDVRDKSLPVVFVNPAFTVMTGYSAEEVLGAPAKRMNGPDTDPEEVARISDTVRSGQATTVTLKSYRRDGTPFWNQVSLAPVKNGCNRVTHFTAIMNDISVKKEQEKRLAYQATHDVLTGLANRSLFEDRLEHDVALARRSRKLLAVLFIDLDEFKPINDTLGHKIGDALLQSVARRLDVCTRPTDTLARFGGDEFVLLLPELESLDEAERVADRVLRELALPHRVGTHELYISASIGISMIDDDLESPEKLLQQADMAMYKAKQRGRDTYEIYSEDLDTRLSKRVTLRNDLQEAIKNNQLYLNYQPQVDADGQLCGMEALLRWKHPEKGFISPADFIPVAEETGQIVHLGKWVTTQACRDARTLMEMGILRGRMAVNLSPLQFHRPGFLSTLEQILSQTGLPARYLELELTEGILMKDSDSAIEILNAINALGVATAIDDFGTGFSSFGYLKNLPVDNIKIDRSFVDKVTTDEKDAAVCKGVIALAREMGLKVVAEGVETLDQFDYLKANGCEVFQGYYFARPMPLDQLIEWINQNRNAA